MTFSSRVAAFLAVGFTLVSGVANATLVPYEFSVSIDYVSGPGVGGQYCTDCWVTGRVYFDSEAMPMSTQYAGETTYYSAIRRFEASYWYGDKIVKNFSAGEANLTINDESPIRFFVYFSYENLFFLLWEGFAGPGQYVPSSLADLLTLRDWSVLVGEQQTAAFELTNQRRGYGYDTSFKKVPEPGTLALLWLGLFGLFLSRQMKRTQPTSSRLVASGSL